MITKQDVEHVAMLARLELTEEEKEMFTQQLNAILEYADQLKQLDTSEIPPTAHAIPMQNVFRDDEVKPGLSNEEAVAAAPEAEDGFFKVPKIV
ncbi:MAG: Asp-tRNA(Asn)/Glu-tRNA(Gln) amidotransferase subunit GatC [Bacillota bacterium]|uniref:Aspartyl/glutamyl-tRNA(Asn/Gln) amidotransferase subunit C n=2 Tax=Carboxydocella TaxID=178898 RepID=A0A1T4R2M5_9FIRM|nr:MULTISPECIES: Asp-tRNA(Asn)/Glu-tRNA(Gln) amidotransferase subunit GatC [Carboxydocella]AVX21740.1 aspartyl/glutamyl-tRNA(Asn/Gln) amidotransferase subunit C [Carboxydocella thermautotrophica]AVX32146.1 aspartyl/glutamyl-tRNA(Asn/Gln) amidotransferase subunit C [Carboxydocella thermautotrophica]SKA10302.1 aspartyl/glutamyl-tRNA(Asn/Gln) amidotransferase subunit C [Carboxydocella sporoproducens DSM 16521]GAW27625.1 asparaginyl/glutamyl-tRNA amidotransferase subunit C [Carboxydocella sp. ULO1]